MNCSENKFANLLERLRNEAFQSTLVQKHAACLIKGGHILTTGVNKRFNVKMQEKTLPLTIHAEVDVLSNVHSRFLKGLDILIIRVNKSKQLMYSRPCNACIEKLYQKGIRKAYYSDYNGNIVYEFVDDMPKLHDSAGARYRQRIIQN